MACGRQARADVRTMRTQKAELHLAEHAVAIEVALGEHPVEVVIKHATQAWSASAEVST